MKIQFIPVTFHLKKDLVIAQLKYAFFLYVPLSYRTQLHKHKSL